MRTRMPFGPFAGLVPGSSWGPDPGTLRDPFLVAPDVEPQMRPLAVAAEQREPNVPGPRKPLPDRLSDHHTDDRIKTLHPDIQADVQPFLDDLYKELGLNTRITQAYRTKAKQDAYYAQGRTEPGRIVTNATGDKSYHNYGLAFDLIELLPGGQVNDQLDYEAIAEIAKRHGFSWGGPKDRPHFQRSYGYKTDDLIPLRPDGSPYPVFPK